MGRKEVLDWVNSTTDSKLAKIEDTASGAIACQLLDIMYPGEVPMSKVNWGAKQSFEFVGNYKILQTCFTKLHIDRFVDVDRLISGRYMDNLEFMQWFKRFFELSGTAKGDYDGAAVRAKGKGADEKPSKASAAPAKVAAPSVSAPSSSRQAASSSAPTAPATKKETATVKPALAPVTSAPKPAASKPLKENKAPAPAPAAAAASKSAPSGPPPTAAIAEAAATEIAQLKQSNENSKHTINELRLEMEGLEKERDFYFDKLRDIEIMLQECEDKGLKSELSESIFKILYATAEGFEPSAVMAGAAAAAAAAKTEAVASLESEVDVAPDSVFASTAVGGEEEALAAQVVEETF